MHRRFHFHTDSFDSPRRHGRGAHRSAAITQPAAQTALDVARHALRNLLRADKRRGDEEQRQIAAILDRAAAEIAGKPSN